MKRVVTTSALAALLMASCAATHYTVRPVTGYVPAQDDGGNCVVAILIPVAVTDSVWARVEWWQSNTLLKRDSTRAPRAVSLTFQPPVEVPNATQVDTRWFLRDVGGTSCMAVLPQTPSQTLVKPAAFSGLAVVP
jgi:hypothetical protein